MKFYTFYLMYTKSNRKLREMLTHSIDSKTVFIQNKNDVDLNIPDMDSIVQTSLGIVDAKHTCRKCLASFRTRKLLRAHVSEVHKKDHRGKTNSTVNSSNSDTTLYRWECSHCMSRFRTRDLKTIHQKECRQSNDMTEIKDSEFVDYNDFDTSEFPSDSEANNFDDNSSYEKEVKFEVNKDTNNLPETSDPSLKRNKTSAGEKWKCKKCSECFDTQQLLHSHRCNQQMERENKLFSDVNIKQEQFEDIEDLHLKTENERHEYEIVSEAIQQNSNFRWKCKTCFLVYGTRELLRTHRRSHTGVRKLPKTIRTGWSCNICNAILSSRNKVRLHKLIDHPNEKRERRRNDEVKNWGDVGQYECELCNKSFISKSKIRKHMDVHKNKDRPKRLCTICGLELCSTYNLNNHIRTVHGRERKFHCTLCDRRFSHSHHLKTHMNRHTGVRPFQCEQCVKSFFDKTTLREHIKSVHLNLKAYACKICSRTFNRSGNMRAHMLKTHNLGNLTTVQFLPEDNRSSRVGNSNNDPPGYESDDFAQRLCPNNAAEPFRAILKLSN